MTDIRIKFTTTPGQLFKALEGEVAGAITRAMVKVATGAKDEIRAGIRAQFKRTPPIARAHGQNFEKSFQAQVYPDQKKRKESLSPSAVIQTKAKAAVEFEEGLTISGRKMLAVPEPLAVRLKLDRGMNKNSRFAKLSETQALKQMFGVEPVVFSGHNGKLFLGIHAAAVRKKGISVPKKVSTVPFFRLIQSTSSSKRTHVVDITDKWAGKLQSAYEDALKD